MKAADDPMGMTDAELERAVKHHQQLGQSYQRIADLHWKASSAARTELEHRQAQERKSS